MRGRGTGQAHRRTAAALLAVLLAAATACADPGDDGADSPPGDRVQLVDPVLRDSAGIRDAADVARVELRHRYGRESATPDTVALGSAAWVDFLSLDGWPRTVEFVGDSLEGPALRFLREAGALSSPPLVRDSARWLVPFRGAPEGVYPYRVRGPREDGSGVVVVGRRTP